MQSEVEIPCPECGGKGFFPEVSFKNCSHCRGFGALLSGPDGIRPYELGPVETIADKPMGRAENEAWKKAWENLRDRELRRGFGA